MSTSTSPHLFGSLRGRLERHKLHLGLAALLFVCFVYPHQRQFNGPTPVSRLDLLHSLWLHKTVSIDQYHVNTPDKARFNGRYYSDKAPGTVALAFVPFAFAAMLLTTVQIDLDSEVGWLFSSWIACAGSIGLITAMGGVALFAWLERHVSRRVAFVTTLALFLGAAPLPYATLMFSHALVIGLLSLAIYAIEKQRERGPATIAVYDLLKFQNSHWSLLAGFACGLALASEFTAGLVVIALSLWLSWNRHAVLLPFCLAATPPLLLIPTYNWLCFGDLLTLPYSHQVSFPRMKEGLYAIKWPNLDTAIKLLFSPERGLIFWTPFFAIAGFGYWRLLKKSRHLFWLTYAVPLLQIVVISGRTWDWPAGPTYGPRLLSPIIPLLALPCAFGFCRFPELAFISCSYSVAITTLATLTDACPPFQGHPNPLFDFHIPLLMRGDFSPNLGMTLGLPPHLSIAAYYIIIITVTWWMWRRLPTTTLHLRHDS